MKYIIVIDGVKSTRYIYNVYSVFEYADRSVSEDTRIFESDNKDEFDKFISSLPNNDAEREDTCKLEKFDPDVAYLRMPLALSVMELLTRFIEKAYGKDCTITEHPKGWLNVRTPNNSITGGEAVP